MKRCLLSVTFLLLLLVLLGGPCSAAPAQPLKYGFVERVVDCYTLEVSVGKRLYTVRLLGITPLETLPPEVTSRLNAAKAEAFVTSRVQNTFVYLEFDEQEKDYSDRLLAYVWLDKPEKRDDAEIRTRMLNAVMLQQGYAQWALTIPNYKYTNYLRSYGQEAQQKGAGIWSKTK